MEQCIYAHNSCHSRTFADCGNKADVQTKPENSATRNILICGEWTNMLNRKGQEGAPFEMLIAVIIMGFVIFAGLNAMREVTNQRCVGQTNAKLEEFKTVIETAVSQKSPQTINFRLSGCFDEADETIKISDWDDATFCADLCGSPKKLCSLLEYSNTGSNPFHERKCLDIPPYAIFPSQKFAGAKCEDWTDDGYELEDLDYEARQGDYILVNKSSAIDSTPTICAYRRVTI